MCQLHERFSIYSIDIFHGKIHLFTSQFKIIRAFDCTNEFLLSAISNMILSEICRKAFSERKAKEKAIFAAGRCCPDVSLKETEKQLQFF